MTDFPPTQHGLARLRIRRAELERTSMARCDEWGCALSKDVLEIIGQIAVLPEAFGEHACDSGHPRCAFYPTASTGPPPAARRFCPRS
jgi:hypothetical protein